MRPQEEGHRGLGKHGGCMLEDSGFCNMKENTFREEK